MSVLYRQGTQAQPLDFQLEIQISEESKKEGGGRKGDHLGGKDRSATARKFNSGGVLSGRVRIPLFFLLCIFVLSFVGLLGLQILKERRISIDTTAKLRETQLQLENSIIDLEEQVKFANDLERQFKLLENSLKGKEKDDTKKTQSVKKTFEKLVNRLSDAKKIVKERQAQIGEIQSLLQEGSYEKAKETTERITTEIRKSPPYTRYSDKKRPSDEMLPYLNKEGKILSKEEFYGQKLAKDGDVSERKSSRRDEAELAKRARKAQRKTSRDEEESANLGDLSAIEKEMEERSQPKKDAMTEGGTISKEKKDQKTNVSIETSKVEGQQEVKSEGQERADLVVLFQNQKETDADQDEEDAYV